MILDSSLMFSEKQTVSATGNSTNTIVVPAGVNAGLEMFVQVIARSESGTSPTLQVELEGSTDDVSYTKLVGVIKPAGKKVFGFDLKNIPVRPYLRLRYVLGGTSPVYNLTAALVAGQSFGATDGVYADSIRIS